MDGLISFFASYHAIRAECLLKRQDFTVLLVPGPKQLSPNCGVALRFEYAKRAEALRILEAQRVRVDQVHFYQPRTDRWRDGWGT